MGMFLNSSAPYEGYKEALRDAYFVDKSLLLKELVPYFEKRNRYCYVTRPRRFGKTVMANMVGAFFGKILQDEKIFAHLDISREDVYAEHRNKHNVIYIDFSRGAKDGKSYVQYINRIESGILDDLILMVSGEHVATGIGQLAASSMEINSREQIYSAMVVYGLLTYEDGAVSIPNKELMDKYNELLLSKD